MHDELGWPVVPDVMISNAGLQEAVESGKLTSVVASNNVSHRCMPWSSMAPLTMKRLSESKNRWLNRGNTAVKVCVADVERGFQPLQDRRVEFREFEGGSQWRRDGTQLEAWRSRRPPFRAGSII